MNTPLKVALIAAAVSLAMAGAVQAANVGPGQTKVIAAGDATNWWHVNNGVLMVGPGAKTRNVSTSDGATIRFDHADAELDGYFGISISDASTLEMVGSTAYNGVERALTLGVGYSPIHGYRGGTASIISSTLSGLGLGASVNNGTLRLADTTLEGRADPTTTDMFSGNGLWLISGGKVDITEGSQVVGDNHGIWSEFNLAGGVNPTGMEVVIDASTVEGRTGAAIFVPDDVNHQSDPSEVNFTVRNGGQLKAGNGNLLQVDATDATVGLRLENTALVGNIVSAAGSIVDVALADGARLQGRIQGATSLALADSVWALTGDSTIGALANGSGGHIVLGDGSALHTLTVAGDYHGDGGAITFNTVLAGDDAASDRLVVGGDTSGQTQVVVNNLGGQGAQTVQGIALVDVGGASNGTFDLAGRAVGGQYEYFLRKDAGNGNWYLRSELPTPPNPCDADPSLPDCTTVVPVPVLRPEAGAYLANLQAGGSMFGIGFQARNAGRSTGRAWARVDGARTGFDAVERQLDVHGNRQSLNVGVDLLRGQNGSAAGVMFATGNASSTATNALTGYYARGKVRGNAAGIYATWRAGNAEDANAGFHLDGSLQRARFRNSVDGLALASERYDSGAWQGAIEAGQAFGIHRSATARLYLEPYLQVGRTRWDDVRHTEANGTVVTAGDADGTFGRVGLRLSGVSQWGEGAVQVQPYVSANWLHDGTNRTVHMDGQAIQARIPQGRAEFSGGASLRFGNGWSASAGLTLQHAAGYHQTSAQLGMSYTW